MAEKEKKDREAQVEEEAETDSISVLETSEVAGRAPGAKNLDKMFKPDSVAIIGATEKKDSVGLTLMENLAKKGDRKVYPVNPNRDSVLGMDTYASVREISDPVDLGVIATPAETVPGIVRECGEAGIPALIIISAGFSEVGAEGEKLEEKIEKIRRKYGMRILGPNCLGIIRPSTDLNASMADQMPEDGSLAFISQSGALATATLDWAIAAQFGFSNFISVGNMVDVDFGDLIDFLGQDPKTNNILLYVESIEKAEKFMSAARGFARTNPIIAVKSGKYEESAQAVVSHTGAIAGGDQAYGAAFSRAGVTRVDTMDDLFICSETLAKSGLPEGGNLLILSNTGGGGILGVDELMGRNGSLASLIEDTVKKLDEILPSRASLSNPVDLTGDTSPEQYKKALKVCLDDPNVDGVICMYAPTGQISPKPAAKALDEFSNSTKPILACWMGGEKVQKGRRYLRRHNIPVQNTPEQSVRAFTYLVQYARNLDRLLETPEELHVDRRPPKYHLKAMIRRAAREGREVLTERESKKILETYGIPSPRIHIAGTASKAKNTATSIGFPVVLKINSPDITHKSVAGGVALNINDKSKVQEKFDEIVSNAREYNPSADIHGVTVQKMITDVDLELILGSKKDPVFGATIMFGRGGTDVEYIKDTSVGLPPLNQSLARMLMEDTTVYEQLKDNKNISSEHLRELESYLVGLSQLIIDFPEIKELDVNPLAVVDGGFLALDARVIIDKELALKKNHEGTDHLVIEPYPRKYVEQWQLDDGTPVTLRPVRPEDEPLEFDLFDTFSEETWRHRFFGPMRDVTHEDIVRYTNIDYRREIAIDGFIEENGEEKMIGVGRIIIDPSNNIGEFAVVVGDPWQGLGLGEKLTDAVIGVAENKGLRKIYGIVLKDNNRMLNLCRKLGFKIEEESKDTMRVSLRLR